MTGKPDITPLDIVIGKNAARIREENKITQEKMAEILDCSDGYISLLESGKRAWKTKWIYRFCQYFKIEPVVLFGGIMATPSDIRLMEAIKERVAIEAELSSANTKS